MWTQRCDCTVCTCSGLKSAVFNRVQFGDRTTVNSGQSFGTTRPPVKLLEMVNGVELPVHYFRVEAFFTGLRRRVAMSSALLKRLLVAYRPWVPVIDADTGKPEWDPLSRCFVLRFFSFHS